MVAAYVKDGLTSLARLDLRSGQFIKLDLPYTEISSVRADAQGRVVFCAGAPDTPMSIARLDLRTGALRVLKQATDVANDPEVKRYFTVVEPVTFQTKGRKKAYGQFYPPANPDFVAPKNELPPLVEFGYLIWLANRQRYSPAAISTTCCFLPLAPAVRSAIE